MVDVVACAEPPEWDHCGHKADTTDPAACRGICVSDYTACLRHLPDADRATYLSNLSAGDRIDHRGTTFSTPLLSALLQALRAGDGRPTFGEVDFSYATFSESAIFDRANFTDAALFNCSIFSDEATFEHATFDTAWFEGAIFTSWTSFSGATFEGDVTFEGATFTHAWFPYVTFNWDADFAGSKITEELVLEGATFGNNSMHFGPLICVKSAVLRDAKFRAPMTMEIAASNVDLQRTRWDASATIHLRYASVELSNAVLSAPVALAAHPNRFSIPTYPHGTREINESDLTGDGRSVSVTSLRGVDATHLVFTDVDLSNCEFAGVFHLDQLRIEGNCSFANPPDGWTRRRVIIEEHYWRALNRWNTAPPWGWAPGPHHPDPHLTPGADDLAVTYRSLRKALEDVKNEPDAADFYYGEMEMRRNDPKRPWGERTLLALYWATSGYGLRVTRALAALGAAITATVVALMIWGIPAGDPPPVQSIRGPLPSGHQIDVSTYARRPGGRAPGPWQEKFSRQRAERAARTALNSVLFHSAGQGLTRPGTYIEMASRLVEPVLLVLAAFALRGRVKR